MTEKGDDFNQSDGSRKHSDLFEQETNNCYFEREESSIRFRVAKQCPVGEGEFVEYDYLGRGVSGFKRFSQTPFMIRRSLTRRGFRRQSFYARISRLLGRPRLAIGKRT